MTTRVLRAVLAIALSCAACSNEFQVLEQREPDGDGPGDASVPPGGDAAFPDARVPMDGRVMDARIALDSTLPSPDAAVLAANVVGAFDQTCAVVEGSLYCWGSDEFGQVGVIGDRIQPTPIKLAADEYIDVCAGEQHTCALRADGTTLCWGGNAHGELGVGDTNARETPTALNSRRFLAIACGGYNTCALAPRGELWCWGDNREGKLGLSDPSMGEPNALPQSPIPLRVETELRFAKLSVSQGHVCALSEQGRLYCWGRNNVGQLGVGSMLAQTRTPLPVVGDNMYASIAAGQFHSCAVDMDGLLWCWGETANGRLGLQTDQAALRVPTRVEGNDFESVSTNWLHSCALKKNGTLFCWGRGVEGQLGGGNESQRDRPAQVGTDGRWRSVGVGWFHTCAFASDGLYCWGENVGGQLGLSDTTRRNVPFKVSF